MGPPMVQYSTVQYSTVQYSTVQYSTGAVDPPLLGKGVAPLPDVGACVRGGGEGEATPALLIEENRIPLSTLQAAAADDQPSLRVPKSALSLRKGVNEPSRSYTESAQRRPH